MFWGNQVLKYFLISLAACPVIFIIVAVIMKIFFFGGSSDAAGDGMAAGFLLFYSGALSIFLSVILFVTLILASRYNINILSIGIIFLCVSVISPFVLVSLIPVVEKAASENRLPALIKAARDGNLKQVIGQIEKGEIVFCADASGTMPLHYAAMEGHFDVVKYLVEHGAEADSPEDAYGSTPLDYARKYNHAGIVSYLLEKGAHDGKSGGPRQNLPIHTAAKEGDLSEVKRQLDNGADIESKGERGCTPLRFAVENNHVGIVEYLLSRGANTEARCGYEYKTPLLEAAANKESLKSLMLLVKFGADIDAKNYRGEDIISIAKYWNNVEAAEYIRRLRESPARPNT